jgi:hypothetical protein
VELLIVLILVNKLLCYAMISIGFLIPGTSGNVELLVSIIKHEGNSLVLAGQGQISFRDIDPNVEDQTHRITINDNIWVSNLYSYILD